MELVRKAPASGQTLRVILAFALLPLSGLAMDVYIPSLPDMAAHLGVTPAAIQLTLPIFIISYGVCQLFIGSLLDSYGRYIPGLVALFGFGVSSFIIATAHHITLIYAMRILQGLAVATIVVGKRAYFVDTFSGTQLKHYTSLFSIIWATAPIVAPFLGGFLQVHSGWQANFHFLGIFAMVMFVLELVFNRESLVSYHPFHLSSIARIYGSMLTARDFIAGLLVLALAYAMLLLYNMASPFLIETLLHYPATVTGNCALLSGVAVLCGGLLSKALITRPFAKKLRVAALLQLIAAAGIALFTLYHSNLYTLLAYVVVLHLLGGFIFNNLFSYCLMLFPQHAGKSGGLTGGGFGIFTSIFSYFLVGSLQVDSQALLGLGYGVLAAATLLLIVFTRWKQEH
ncbi:MFS transporter [Chitinophaga japonensis]|uniref:Putative MFS family arabinose efflux permease n=1 Tax=Chitinophaga japonensis TaxID=104662 RepID=A0A562T0I6_CHIJA|nr:MFS transporter [Chitinophaga japonensis]TWI86774.1 putative MFS family arabinose efflux permease [Chitinophaga japonensis]